MIISNLIKGTFEDRPNRFTVKFKINTELEAAHLRDPGRLQELLFSDAQLLLRPAENTEKRKTRYDVIAVLKDGLWVLINSGFHSDIAAQLVDSGKIDELSAYSVEKREYSFGNGRIDFLLKDEALKKILLEVKGCTLVEDGLALFPDAPTARGKKHVEELVRAKKQGFKSAVIFLIMREDAMEFSPNYRTDPDFSHALFHAYQKGVKVIAFSFKNFYQKKKLKIKPFKSVPVNFRPRK